MQFDIQKDEFTEAESLEHLLIVLNINAEEELEAEKADKYEYKDAVHAESLQYLREYITHLFRQQNNENKLNNPKNE